MLFLDFVFEDRDIKWLTWLEAPLARIGKLDQLSVVVALSALVLAVKTLATEHADTVMVSGVLGVVTYLLVNGLGELFEAGGHDEDPDEVAADTPGHEGVHGDASGKIELDRTSGGGPSEVAKATGKAGFFLFLYLEVIDASFSFDGVIGAFAITQDIFIIAVGLGVGAMYIRSITVYLVRKGTLSDYVYLEHGAMWAIGALAVILLITIRYEVPEIVTGLIGVAFILAAFVSSLVRNRRLAAEEGKVTEREAVTAGR